MGQQWVVVSGGGLDRRQQPLGVLEAAELVERLAEQHTGLGGRPGRVRRGGQALDAHEVVVDSRHACRPDEERRVRRPRGVEAGEGDADRVVATAGAVGIDASGEVQQQSAPRQHRHPVAQDLAVLRVRHRHDLAAAVGADRQQPGPIERFQLVVPDGVLEHRQADRLPHRNAVQGVEHRRRQRSEAGRHDLAQPRRGDERASESPHAVLHEQVATVERAEHQLADVQRVAAAGLPEVVDRRALDRTTEHQVQQRVDAVAMEVAEIDPAHAGPLPDGVETGRERLAVAHRPDEEQQVGVEQLPDERRRRGVEQVHVVDEEHHPTVLALFEEHRTDLRHHLDEIGPFVADAGWQQVGERPERDHRQALGRRRPRHVATPGIGHGEALVGEAGLAHAGQSVDHEPVGAGLVQGRAEQLDLLVATDQRPLQGNAPVRGRDRTPRTSSSAACVGRLSAGRPGGVGTTGRSGCCGRRRRCAG